MNRASDIDIGVEAGASFPCGRIAELREQSAESTIPYGVDVVFLNMADADFRRRVVREGRRWIG